MAQTGSETGWEALGITPGAIVRVFGLRRSGNHAVINWLIRNAPDERSLFLNNCGGGRSPLKAYKNIEVNGAGCGGGSDELQKCAAEAGEGAAVIFSYEDTLPTPLLSRPVSPGISEESIDHEVLVYRGFLNWSASLVRKLQNNPGYNAAKRTSIVLRAIDLYGQALALVTDQHQLGLVAICYDDWIASREYRGAILDKMAFAQRDDSLGPVARYGGGSSFDGHADDVAQMATGSRWQQMADDPEYRIVLWLAGQDAGFCDALSLVFPDDAARLIEFAATTVCSPLPDTVEAAQ